MNKKDVIITVDGIKLSGTLYTPGNQPPYPAVCICHGIPSGTVDPGDGGYPVLAERICQEGFTTFIFNFRGARNSGGNFDMRGWLRDLKAVIDYLAQQPEVAREQLALIGYSAGAAVSVCTAAKDKRIAAVAACACPAELASVMTNPPQLIQYFRSIGIVRDADFPASIEEWLAGFKEATAIHDIGKIAPRPLLIVHGTQDDLVKVTDAQQLYNAAGEPKKLVLIEGAGHRLRREEPAVQTVIDWLKAILNN
ncbi:MAG: alpha/beta fold hydrolase [Dehalococcoidales bacterium]|nr:alpha/beta fold hydrolase [Dehalococcoidales bacterium]